MRPVHAVRPSFGSPDLVNVSLTSSLPKIQIPRTVMNSLLPSKLVVHEILLIARPDVESHFDNV